MAYRRRRTYARKKRTPRTYRRRFLRKRYSKKTGQRIYRFTRHATYAPLIIQSVTETVYAQDFSLNDVWNYTEFTNLYDMYKICAVKIIFTPQQTVSNSLSSINNANASTRFYSAIDYNDAATVTVAQIREYQTCKMTPILKRHKRFIYPKIMDYNLTYNPGKPWITCGAPAVNYYGLKCSIEPMDSSSTTSMEYSVEAKFYLMFKNVK